MLYRIILFFPIFVFVVFSSKSQEINNKNYFKLKSEMNHNLKNDSMPGWKQSQRWQNFWERRVDDKGNFPNGRKIIEEYQEFLLYPNNEGHIATWHEYGPPRVPENLLPYESSGLGRVNCIRIDPEFPNILWAGSASGGVWKSVNYGFMWMPMPQTSLLSMGVSDIAIFPPNGNIAYVATGDANGISMTGGYSAGIIKTTDGGKSWSFTQKTTELSDLELVSRLLVHPHDPDIVICATNRGIFRTTDGGDTWNLTLEGGFFRDMEFKPDDPNIVYACRSMNKDSSEIFKSNDNGLSWHKKIFLPNRSRVALSVTPANPQYVYAITVEKSSQGFGELYSSKDAGNSWFQVSSSPDILGIDPYGEKVYAQGNYDLALTCSPTDENLIYAGGIHIWKSTNGGVNWNLVNHWTGNYDKPYVHADQHDLAFSRDGSKLYSANDGGVYVTEDLGNTWDDISQNLSITQFYSIDIIENDSIFVIGGSQDNGIIFYDTHWKHALGGDAMKVIAVNNSMDTLVACSYFGEVTVSFDKGKTFKPIFNNFHSSEINTSWEMPIAVSNSSPPTIFAGHENVWKTDNFGDNWDKISDFHDVIGLNCIAITDDTPTKIYASNDENLYFSEDGGQSWDKIDNAPELISSIALNDDHSEIWVSISGFRDNEKVFRYKNNKWDNFSFNLPNVPVNTLYYQDDSDNIIYAGTDIGVFYFDVFSKKWIDFSQRMPHLIVNDLKYRKSTNTLYAGTFGRGIWKTNAIDCNMNEPTISRIADTLFTELGYVYKWYLNDIEIPYSNSHRLTIENSGIYYVRIKENYCSAISAPFPVEYSSIYLKDSDSLHIDCYVSNNRLIFNINNAKSNRVLLKLFNQNGKIIEQIDFFIDNIYFDNSINLSNYALGVYFALFEIDGNTYVKKVILN